MVMDDKSTDMTRDEIRIALLLIRTKPERSMADARSNSLPAPPN